MLPSRQTEFQQRAIEKLPGMVAEKRTPGAVGALQARGQSNNQETCAVGAERGNGAIKPIEMRFPILGTKGDEPWAERTVGSGFRRSMPMRHGA